MTPKQKALYHITAAIDAMPELIQRPVTYEKQRELDQIIEELKSIRARVKVI